MARRTRVSGWRPNCRRWWPPIYAAATWRWILRCPMASGFCGRWASAIRFYHRGLEVEPLAEELYQRLMLCYRNSGRKAEALAIYQRCRTNLSAGLDLAPSPLTEELRASIQR